MSAEADRLLIRAETFITQRSIEQGRRCFDLAEREGADPDRCSGGRWIAAMLAGDFEAAWQESDELRRRSARDPHRLWNGEAFDGQRVIVRCLHGFGDAVQMLRFATRLSQVAASVVYEVAPRFVEVARCVEGIGEVITWGTGAPDQTPRWDVQIEIMELPYIFRTTCRDLPIVAGYLRVPDKEKELALRRMGGHRGPRVGVVWAAGEWNVERSIPFSMLESLLATERIEFWSLQGGAAAVQTQEAGVRDVNAICGDGLLQLAAAIAQLDLVVTVDTLAAHLAGAMGIRVWVLLHYAADWRWMTKREDSPWYPTMRLFRQRQAGDWISVLEEVMTALREEYG